MNLHLKYNFEKACRTILQEQLEKFNLNYTIASTGTVLFHDPVPMDEYMQLRDQLGRYGIEIIDNQKAVLVQKIKAAVREILEKNDLPLVKMSTYLSESLGENYRTLSNVFSEVCHISIESFIILQKIEIVKQLLVREGLSLTEISYRMSYSSVAHLSNQFKKMTGFTPTVFQKVFQNKRTLSISVN